jgi:hypothetical protein
VPWRNHWRSRVVLFSGHSGMAVGQSPRFYPRSQNPGRTSCPKSFRTPPHTPCAPPCPLTQVRDSYGCPERSATGERSRDGGGSCIEVRPWADPTHRGEGRSVKNVWQWSSKLFFQAGNKPDGLKELETESLRTPDPDALPEPHGPISKGNRNRNRNRN